VTISDEESIATRSTMRGIILAIFLFGILSAGVELLLLGHTESPWQWIPLVLIVVSLIALVFHAAIRHAAALSRLRPPQPHCLFVRQPDSGEPPTPF